ncbi:hypothetical protein V8G54_029612 [Vigna mungo]|uniref:Folate-biopterin transporter 1, chloroplastic n=1 Tax=Vigna mungo TaxID=3915 RepID=A0AAQ3MUV3_VIGMU
MTCVYILSLLPFLPSKFSNFHPSLTRRTPIISHTPPFRRRTRRNQPEMEMSGTVSRSGSSLRLSSEDSDPFLVSRINAGKDDALTTEIDLEASSSSKVAPRKHKYRMSSIKLFGVELSPDNVAVAMVYFVQGVLGLARLAVNFYLKDDLHLDPAEVDSVPLFGYRRRSYLVLSGLFGALSWSLMATFVDNKYSAAFCILLGSFSVAFSDVVSVSYLVIHICFSLE